MAHKHELLKTELMSKESAIYGKVGKNNKPKLVGKNKHYLVCYHCGNTAVKNINNNESLCLICNKKILNNQCKIRKSRKSLPKSMKKEFCEECEELLPLKSFCVISYAKFNSNKRNRYSKFCRKCEGEDLRYTAPPKGMKWCNRCGKFEPLENFYEYQGHICKKQLLNKRSSNPEYREYSNNWLKNYYKKNPEIQEKAKANAAKYMKSQIENIGDTYVDTLLYEELKLKGTENKELRREVKQELFTKEVYELKRTIVRLKREAAKQKEKMNAKKKTS